MFRWMVSQNHILSYYIEAHRQTIIPIALFRASHYNELMQHRKTISLTAKDDAFIASQLDCGEYGNASEVVRAGLRLLEQEKLKLAALRQAIDEGDAAFARGEFKTYNAPGQLAADLKAKLLKNHDRSRD
jgi:antitoxin ParD1/3/4